MPHDVIFTTNVIFSPSRANKIAVLLTLAGVASLHKGKTTVQLIPNKQQLPFHVPTQKELLPHRSELQYCMRKSSSTWHTCSALVPSLPCSRSHILTFRGAKLADNEQNMKNLFQWVSVYNLLLRCVGSCSSGPSLQLKPLQSSLDCHTF